MNETNTLNNNANSPINNTQQENHPIIRTKGHFGWCLNTQESLATKQQFQHLEQIITKQYPFNLWYNCEPFTRTWCAQREYLKLVYPFMSELMQCNDQLFYKYLCYFKSPTRYVETTITAYSCYLVSDTVNRFREYCKKYESGPTALTLSDKMGWINSMFEVATGKTTRDESFKYGNKEFKSKGILYYNKYKTLGYMVSNSRSNNGLKSLLILFLEMFTSLNDPSCLEYTFHTCFMFDEDRLLLNCARPYKNEVNLKSGSIAERLRIRRSNQNKDYEEINVD